MGSQAGHVHGARHSMRQVHAHHARPVHSCSMPWGRAAGSACAVLFVVAVAICVPAGVRAYDIGDGQATTLDPTLLLLGDFDWKPYPDGPATSRCTDMVKRVGGLRTRRLQIVPTHYWRDDGSAAGGVGSYCWMDGQYNCRSFTKDDIAAFEAGITMCLRAALSFGFTELSVTPHLDNGDKSDWSLRTWRNGLVFDPRRQYGGWSYQSIMLEPLARAIAPFAAPGGGFTHVNFALQGEMGATVVRYPSQYKDLIPHLRSIIQSGGSSGSSGGSSSSSPSSSAPSQDPAVQAQGGKEDDGVTGVINGQGGLLDRVGLGGLARLMIGGRRLSETDGNGPPAWLKPTETAGHSKKNASVGGAGRALLGSGGARLAWGLTFNFVYSDGSQALASSGTLGKIAVGVVGSAYGFRTGGNAPAYDPSAVASLFKVLDFIGISAYAPLTPSFQPTDLQSSIFNVLDTFSGIGVDLGGILRQTHAQLHFVEFGLGGGASQNGDYPAPSVAAAAQRPFWGVTGSYQSSKDPWRRSDLSSFREAFWQRALKWLETGGGGTYGVGACFVWGKASWDVLGVYPESYSSEGSYRSDSVISAVAQHNGRITGMGG